MKEVYLKKDLLAVFVLTLIVVASFVALAYFDQRSNLFEEIGKKVFEGLK